MGEVTWLSPYSFAIHYHHDAPGGTEGILDLENHLSSLLQVLNFQPLPTKEALYR
jgi:hypothetical protein